jgi:protein O-mannosyl-transferase
MQPKNKHKKQPTRISNPKVPAVPPAKKFHTEAWMAIIFFLAFALYANSIPHAFVLDDFGVIKDNWVIKKGTESIPLIMKTPYRYGVSHLTDNLYRPLSLVMFATEWQISPDNPALHHFINVLFYALSCAILFLLLRRLFRDASPLLAIFITLLWTAHPIHTEVVANIKSRDEIMSVFFFLLTFLCFLKYLDGKSILWMVLAVVLFTLAFFSKEGVITCLAVFPLAGWYYTKAKPVKNLAASAAFILPAILYILVRQWVWSQIHVPQALSVTDNLLVGTKDMMVRTATAIYLLGKYLLLLIVPYQLVSDYSFNQIPLTGFSDPLVWVSFLVYAGAIVWSVMNLKKKSAGVFGVLFFLISVSLYSNLVLLIGSSFAERFMYLPSIGISIFLGWLILKIPGLVKQSGFSPKALLKSHPLAWGVLVLVLVLYSGKTFSRNAEWKDQLTLFGADVKRSPNSTHMRYYWGLTVRDKAKDQQDTTEYKRLMMEAIGQMDTALMIYPLYVECYEQLGLAWYRMKDPDRALKYYNEAIKMNPYNAVTYSNMGMLFFEKKDYAKSIEIYQKAIALDSNFDDAYLNLGSVYGNLQQFDLAIKNFKKGLQFRPNDPTLYFYIGISYRSLKNDVESKKYLDKAYELDPSLKK